MPKPEEYKWIQRWGEMLNSFPYYIRNQQQEASDDSAPLSATYKRDGKWHTIEEVQNEDTQTYMRIRYNDCPEEWTKENEDPQR